MLYNTNLFKVATRMIRINCFFIKLWIFVLVVVLWFLYNDYTGGSNFKWTQNRIFYRIWLLGHYLKKSWLDLASMYADDILLLRIDDFRKKKSILLEMQNKFLWDVLIIRGLNVNAWSFSLASILFSFVFFFIAATINIYFLQLFFNSFLIHRQNRIFWPDAEVFTNGTTPLYFYEFNFKIFLFIKNKHFKRRFVFVFFFLLNFICWSFFYLILLSHVLTFICFFITFTATIYFFCKKLPELKRTGVSLYYDIFYFYTFYLYSCLLYNFHSFDEVEVFERLYLISLFILFVFWFGTALNINASLLKPFYLRQMHRQLYLYIFFVLILIVFNISCLYMAFQIINTRVYVEIIFTTHPWTNYIRMVVKNEFWVLIHVFNWINLSVLLFKSILYIENKILAWLEKKYNYMKSRKYFIAFLSTSDEAFLFFPFFNKGHISIKQKFLLNIIYCSIIAAYVIFIYLFLVIYDSEFFKIIINLIYLLLFLIKIIYRKTAVYITCEIKSGRGFFKKEVTLIYYFNTWLLVLYIIIFFKIMFRLEIMFSIKGPFITFWILNNPLAHYLYYLYIIEVLKSLRSACRIHLTDLINENEYFYLKYVYISCYNHFYNIISFLIKLAHSYIKTLNKFYFQMCKPWHILLSVEHDYQEEKRYQRKEPQYISHVVFITYMVVFIILLLNIDLIDFQYFESLYI